MYIVKYSKGSYEDYHNVTIFVTNDKEYAETYVKKFNTKLEYWKNYYRQFSSEFSETSIKEEFLYTINADRFWEIMEINSAFILTTEFRTSKKINV